jgi:hypothetical protein
MGDVSITPKWIHKSSPDAAPVAHMSPLLDGWQTPCDMLCVEWGWGLGL